MAQVDFENLLKNAMGLDPPSIGSAAIERAVRQRMASLGLNQTDDYKQQVRGSKDELQELIEAVVVPETWFFRDPAAFATMVRLIADEWRPAGPASAVRLLSVPCSTGEEPYSIAMSLLDAGFPPQQIRVDAVDISARVLACATRGVYGPNSFRGADQGFRERYFQVAANDYTLADSVRRLVTFRQTNLLSPEFSFGAELYDVIFCRNLLIYFDRSTQDKVMKTLARLLKPSGFLFVGPAEAFLASCSGLTSVNHAMSFAFRRNGGASAGSEAPFPEPKSVPIKKQSRPRPHPTTIAPIPLAAAPRPAKSPGAGLEIAQRLADAGQLHEAAASCETTLLEEGPSCEIYYLLGLVRDAIGDRHGAAMFYRKAIYLEPEHVEGLTHLALITEMDGDLVAAERLRERARRVEGTANGRAS